MPAGLSTPPITPAETATAPSVNPWPKHAGWKNKNWNSCRWDTFIWSLLCPMNSTGSSSSIRNPSSTFCFTPSRRPCLEFARTHLGGTLGLTTVLHTWDQTLLDHFHLHCLVPAGALSSDQNR